MTQKTLEEIYSHALEIFKKHPNSNTAMYLFGSRAEKNGFSVNEIEAFLQSKVSDGNISTWYDCESRRYLTFAEYLGKNWGFTLVFSKKEADNLVRFYEKLIFNEMSQGVLLEDCCDYPSYKIAMNILAKFTEEAI